MTGRPVVAAERAGIPVRLARAARQHWAAGLLAIVALATGLRLWGIGFGLPYTYHPDEPLIVERALRFFATGDLNPRWFNYPTLYTYLIAGAYRACYGLGLWGGEFSQASEMPAPQHLVMGGGFTEVPGQFLIARLVTAGLGVITVALSCYVATRLWDRRRGLLAGLFVAVSSLHAASSQMVATDVPMAFFVTLSLAFCVRLVRSGRWGDYVLAGLTAGLAMATKYNAAPVLVSLVTAHVVRSYPKLADWRLLVGLAASGVGFAVGTPYAFLEWQTFWSDVTFEMQHYAEGHPGFEGENTWWWILRVLVGQEALLLPLGVLGGVASGLRRVKKEALPLFAFVLLYYGVVARQVVRFSRNLVVLVPVLAILAAGFVGFLLRRAESGRYAGVVRGLVMVGLGASLVLPLSHVIRRDRLLAGQDVRTTAAGWIRSHLETDSRIAGESYGPTLDPEVYDVQYVVRAVDHSPEWYSEQGFDYLMLSSGMYGRYYHEPERYADMVAQYDSLFASFPTVATFEGPMSAYPEGEIVVLRVE